LSEKLIKKDDDAGGAPHFFTENAETVADLPAAGQPPGLLESVYGVLFEPGKTMRKIVDKPPLGLAALIVAFLSVLGSLMGILIFLRMLGPNAVPGRHLLPFLVAVFLFAGVLWGFLKWFIYSAILHLAAELLGGRGRAAGVFAVAGLSGMPTVFLIPVQFLCYWFGAGNTAAAVPAMLAALAVAVWSAVILVIGLKQTHGLSTGRSVFVVFSPLIAFFAIAVLTVAVLVALAVSMPSRMSLPGYF